MIAQADPVIARPVPKKIGDAALTGTKSSRYAPERGLIRRLRGNQANSDIQLLTERHKLDPDTRDVLGAELIKAGAPPITAAAAELALSRLVRFEPLNADALHPFLMLARDRAIRAIAVARVGDTMRSAGRSVRLMSDAVDGQQNAMLQDAAKRLGCDVQNYDGSPHCVDLLRRTDLACLSIVEAGFRAPLDRVAMLRLHTLVQATGAEPIAVVRPGDAALALTLSKIGVKRIVLALSDAEVSLGPILTALRKGNLALAEILSLRDPAQPMTAATAGNLAALLAGS